MDPAALEAVKASVEQACVDFDAPATRQQAEARLLEFRQSSSPLQACKYILEHSGLVTARFQALLTLRETVVRDWGQLSPQSRAELRLYLLHRLLAGAVEPEQVVRTQLTATLAAVLKRGWNEQSQAERETFFQEVEGAVTQRGDPQSRRTGMDILSAVITEFSPPTASAMGLPWGYHEKCRMSLEKDFLQRFFVHACNIGRQAMASGAVASDSDGGTCAACVTLLSTILSWDFQRGGGGISGGGFGFVPEAAQRGGTGSETLMVHLGPVWRDVLLSPGAFGWLVELAGVLHGQSGKGKGPLATATRHLVVQLCSVTGAVFGKDEQGKEAKVQYCRVLLQAVLAWGTPTEMLLQAGVQGDFDVQEQLVDCCRGMLALATTHRALGFLQAAEGTALATGPDSVLGAIVLLTRGLVACGHLEEGFDGDWSSSAAEIMLETWNALVEGASDIPHEAAVQLVTGACYAVFEAYIGAALKDLAASLTEDDDEDDADGGAGWVRAEEWMTRLAVLGRTAASQALPLLTGLLNHRLQQLQQCAAAGSDPSLVLEELCWLLRCAAHTLADAGEGETPMVPIQLVEMVEKQGEGQPCPIHDLSTALITVTSTCLDPAARAVLSPRVLEIAIACAARWCKTYLMPEEKVPASLAVRYSVAGSGMQILDTLVKVSRELLSSWPGEAELHLAATKQLLGALVCRHSLTTAILRLESWQLLVKEFAERAGWTKQIASRPERALCKAIVTAAQGLGTQQEVQHYLSGCLQFLPAMLSAIVQHRQQGVDFAAEAASALDIIRGAASATSPAVAATVWALMEGLLQLLLEVFQAYKSNDIVVTLVIKVANDLVEGYISFIDTQQANKLCLWVLQLIRFHAGKERKGHVVATLNQAMQEQDELAAYRELRALLKLLTHLTQRDLQELQTDVDIPQAVFMGLEIILPRISAQMAHFPKLRHLYFNLLSYMAEAFPEQVARLSVPQFAMLAASLEYGVRQVLEAEALQAALEATAALGLWHLKAIRAGHPGLTSQQMPSGDGFVPQMMESVLHRLLFDDSSMDSNDAAADALLPLLLSSPNTYQSLGNALLSQRQQAGDASSSQEALAQALGMLVHGIQDGTTRVDRRKFRSGLGKFLVAVRGIVRTR